MSEQRALLTETVDRLFATLTADDWQQVEDMALPTLMLPETQGGFGGAFEDLYIVQRAAGYHGVALPIGEAILGNWLRADVGGRVSVAESPASVPWGRDSAQVIFASEGALQLGRIGAIEQARTNIAGEPRDHVRVADAQPLQTALNLVDYLAVLRLGQITGAMERALNLTVDYVKTRVQFGKPIGSFQAVQQQLAVCASEVAAVACAAQAAHQATDRGDGAYAIACAKLRVNQAIGFVTATTHQLHGAIGFTQDYGLHPFTRRLWAWRSEYGNDRFWAERLGRHVVERGVENAWPDLTAA
jgi:acyl-CoA dehydrogenase